MGETMTDPQRDGRIIELCGLRRDAGDLAGPFQQPSHGDGGHLLPDPDRLVGAVPLVGVQPGPFLGTLVEVQQ